MKKKWWLSIFLIVILVFNTLAVFAEDIGEELNDGIQLEEDGNTLLQVIPQESDSGSEDEPKDEPKDDENEDTPLAPPVTKETTEKGEDKEGEGEGEGEGNTTEEEKFTKINFDATQLISFLADYNFDDNEYIYELGLEYWEDGQWKKADTIYSLTHDGKYNFQWSISPGTDKPSCFQLYIKNTWDQSVIKLPMGLNWITGFEINLTICFSCLPTMEVEATKVWSNPEEDHPTVWFKLYKQSPRGKLYPVGGIKELKNGVTKVSWNRYSFKSLCGKEPIYVVKEVDAQGKDFTPEGYSKKEDGLTVINTKDEEPPIPTTVWVKAVKIWITGLGEDPFKRPEVSLQLYQNDKPYGEVVLLKNKTYSYVWKELPELDETGKAYVYKVDEIDVPEGYKKTVVNLKNVYTITNCWIATDKPDLPEKPVTPKPDKPVTPVTPKPPYKPSLPRTGADASGLYLGLVSLIAGVNLLLGRKK